MISRRLEVDEQHVQVIMARDDRWDKLHADIPIKRQKISFEWDLQHTPLQVMRYEATKIRVDVERLEDE